MTTIIKSEQKATDPASLSYYDGKNIIKVEDQFYLIAQCDYGKMVLFELMDRMEWNRNSEPINVKWSDLNTETICDYYPEFQGKKVERVNCKITFEI